MALYTIGAIVMDCPMGLNPQDVVEEFGGDFAVKPVVGAQQPREFVGPADTRLVLSGTIFPFRYAAAGGSSGQTEIAQLKAYAAAGEPLPVTRGDGAPMGYYIVERVQLKHGKLAKTGIGRQQEFVLQMVQTPKGPSQATLTNIFTGLISLLGQATTASQ